MVSSKLSTAIAISCLTNVATAFVAPQRSAAQGVHHDNAPLSMAAQDENNEVSRRGLFTKSAAAFVSIASVATGNPGLAFAAKVGPTSAELDRIKVGYERMCYLLDNFEQETTVCRVSSSHVTNQFWDLMVQLEIQT